MGCRAAYKVSYCNMIPRPEPEPWVQPQASARGSSTRQFGHAAAPGPLSVCVPGGPQRMAQKHSGKRDSARPASKQQVGRLASSPGLRLALALEIERHCSADEILQGRLIDLVAFVDVDGAPDIPVEAGVE